MPAAPPQATISRRRGMGACASSPSREPNIERGAKADAPVTDEYRLHVVDGGRRPARPAEQVQHQPREHTADQRHDHAVPPDELCGRVHQALRLAGEQQLEQARPFAECHAGERAADADEGRPEDDPREVLMAEEDQPQPG